MSSGEAKPAVAAAAAAAAAVQSYLARRKAGGSTGSGVPPGGPSLWALYGRQALMNQRIRMQARRRA